ncbi:galactose-specific lectin nattectin-like isoform X2 [Hemibagrus wyckioides]|uniref:galactose-specific lectin nattectin-like isoform X2 n=1 Tax=Hemibagrus wyckioides TaxID=337641 RepID=UPI00266BA028|nr:galactose-specific lectin nattectin-like isoform X2 [Hemibagrus wyckioides]
MPFKSAMKFLEIQKQENKKNTSRKELIVHRHMFPRTDMSSVLLFILIFSGFWTLSFTQTALKCQRGWSQFGLRCFRIFITSTSWGDAEQNCMVMGGHLASVHSIEEYNFIQALVLNAFNSNAQTWLGASDIREEGIWEWTDGSAWDYINWSGGQPDNDLNIENCLMMNFPVCWNDANCANLMPSACASQTEPDGQRNASQCYTSIAKDFQEANIDCGICSNIRA